MLSHDIATIGDADQDLRDINTLILLKYSKIMIANAIRWE